MPKREPRLTLPPLPAGPAPAEKIVVRPGIGRRRAICCSGGGIRAAAFCLGGLQRLDRRDAHSDTSYYGSTDFVTAVSGGAYIAAALAVGRHRLGTETGARAENKRLTKPNEGRETEEIRVYAPGSEEDTRLRAHTKYLVEDKLAFFGGLLGILYGLIINVVPLLAITYLAAAGTGTVLTSWLHVLRWDGTSHHWDVHLSSAVGITALGLLVAGAAAYAGLRMLDLYRTRPLTARQVRAMVALALGCFAAAGIVALALIALPACLHLADGAAKASDHQVLDPWAQLATVGGTLSALVPVIASFLKRTAADAKKVASVVDSRGRLRPRVVAAILPWSGTIVLAVLFLGAYLVWTSSAAWRVATDTHGSGLSAARHEWSPALLAATVLFVWHAVTDLNRDSLHTFYADRLAFAFTGRRRNADRRTAAGNDVASSGLLSALARPSDGGPELVLCAAANTDQAGVVPTGRRCAPVTFSPHRSGISAGTMFGIRGPGAAGVSLAELETGDAAVLDWQHKADRRLTQTTADFERTADRKQLTVYDLVAVSGAALAPVMGRMTRPSVRVLLGIANIGLGMWLPNPLHPPRAAAPTGAGRRPRRIAARIRWQLHQPGLRALLWELFGGTSLTSRWIYVTDGGHYENLGLVEALRRGATEITVLDATGDTVGHWTTLGEAIETARVDLGVTVDIDPEQMVTIGTDGKSSVQLAITGSILFPDGTPGTLYFCKLQKGTDVPWDVIARYASHPSFPVESSLHQLYDDREFEAYRMLGWCAADQARTLAAAGVPADREPSVRNVAATTVDPTQLPAVPDVVRQTVRPRQARRLSLRRPGIVSRRGELSDPGARDVALPNVQTRRRSGRT